MFLCSSGSHDSLGLVFPFPLVMTELTRALVCFQRTVSSRRSPSSYSRCMDLVCSVPCCSFLVSFASLQFKRQESISCNTINILVCFLPKGVFPKCFWGYKPIPLVCSLSDVTQGN